MRTLSSALYLTLCMELYYIKGGRQRAYKELPGVYYHKYNGTLVFNW